MLATTRGVTTPELVDLRQVNADELQVLLRDESGAWARGLNWDFGASAELVQRFVRVQALNGFALRANEEVIGYSYFVAEDRKGLIGDLYLRGAQATPENENRLLSAILESLIRSHGVRRIESQLMMLRHPPQRLMPYSKFMSSYQRQFMTMDLSAVDLLPPGPAQRTATFDPWQERRQDESAQLIADAYYRHIDSQINDQYRSAAGARRFLLNIVQYPGCGTFFAPASLVAMNPASGRMCGLLLCSQVNRDAAHITQICVAPAAKGMGVGYELMRRALQLLQQQGMRQASLTVTVENRRATDLYARIGFHTVRRFAAHVWEGFV